jgi:hypothetical protein
MFRGQKGKATQMRSLQRASGKVLLQFGQQFVLTWHKDTFSLYNNIISFPGPIDCGRARAEFDPLLRTTQ